MEIVLIVIPIITALLGFVAGWLICTHLGGNGNIKQLIAVILATYRLVNEDIREHPERYKFIAERIQAMFPSIDIRTVMILVEAVAYIAQQEKNGVSIENLSSVRDGNVKRDILDLARRIK